MKIAVVGGGSTYTPELVDGFARRAGLLQDAVLIQLRVGGQQTRLRDETIPGRYGFVGQETTGPGGFAKALRTVPVVLEVAERTAEIGAADAWVVDFTNPTGLVTQALLDQGHRACGLCNVAIGVQRALAAIPSSYLRYYYRTGEVLEYQRTHRTRAEEVIEIEAGLLELYRDPTL